MLSNNELNILNAAIAGDPSAFEALILPYESKIYNIAYQMFRNEQDAFDAAQEILIKVYRNLAKFNHESAFSTWLYRLAKNTCIDEYRKRKRHQEHTQSMQIHSDGETRTLDFEDHTATPEQTILQQEVIQEVHKALDLLKPEQKIILVYRDLQGMAYDEIADILDVSLGTVKSRISRARIALKEKILELREQSP